MTVWPTISAYPSGRFLGGLYDIKFPNLNRALRVGNHSSEERRAQRWRIGILELIAGADLDDLSLFPHILNAKIGGSDDPCL